MKVKREYEETVTTKGSRGPTTRTRRGSEVVADNERSIPFQLEDESGSVTVDLTDGSIETVEVVDEFKPAENSAGSIVFGGFRMNLPAIPGGRRTIGYRYTESILPVNSTVLVVGAVSDSTGELRICQSADGKKKLLVSTRAYDVLVSSASKAARWSRNATVAFVVGGAGLLLLGLLS